MVAAQYKARRMRPSVWWLTAIDFHMMTSKPPKVRCTWTANVPNDYEDWAAERTQRQLAKAGFRLGMMLRAIYE